MLEKRDGVYANAAETDFYLDRAKPSYIGGLLEMANRRLYASWGKSDRGAAERRNRRTKPRMAGPIPSPRSMPTPPISKAF